MLCFAVDQDNSGDDCVDKWIRELRINYPQVPIVLVLMKNDLLEDEEYKNGTTETKFDVQKLE